MSEHSINEKKEDTGIQYSVTIVFSFKFLHKNNLVLLK